VTQVANCPLGGLANEYLVFDDEDNGHQWAISGKIGMLSEVPDCGTRSQHETRVWGEGSMSVVLLFVSEGCRQASVQESGIMPPARRVSDAMEVSTAAKCDCEGYGWGANGFARVRKAPTRVY
jgi:hypothetical protein